MKSNLFGKKKKNATLRAISWQLSYLLLADEPDGLGTLFPLPEEEVGGRVVVVRPVRQDLVHHLPGLSHRHGHLRHALVVQLHRLVNALPLNKKS